MDAHSIGSAPSSPRWTAPGHSLVELIVTIVVMGMIGALLTPLVLSARGMVMSDQLRTQVNQSVRTGSDLIGTDIRMAGERFPRGSALQLPPIEIVVGTAGAPDELVLRRNLWEGTLPVCTAITSGSTINNVRVVQDAAWLSTPPGDEYPECGQPIGSDGWPANLSSIRTLANTIGVAGILLGYIFDPSAGVGEFITFEVLDDADTSGRIHRVPATAFQHAYPLENRPRIYVLEERRYRVVNDILELVVNEDEAGALRVSGDISNLRARYILADGSSVTTLPTGSTWRDVRSVEVTLSTDVTQGHDQIQRQLTARFFPRNILSR